MLSSKTFQLDITLAPGPAEFVTLAEYTVLEVISLVPTRDHQITSYLAITNRNFPPDVIVIGKNAIANLIANFNALLRQGPQRNQQNIQTQNRYSGRTNPYF